MPRWPIRSALLAASLAILLPSCKVPDPFSAEQRAPTYNWIGGAGFGSYAERPNAFSSAWSMGYATDLSTGAVADDPSWDGYGYMRLEADGSVGSGAVSGLDASAAVFRLSIANLFPNGALEATADPGSTEAVGAPNPARWGVEHDVHFTPDDATMDIRSSDSIHGQSLHFNRTQTGQAIALDLSGSLLNRDAGGSGTGIAAGSLYQVNFLFRRLDTATNLSYFYGSSVPSDPQGSSFLSVSSDSATEMHTLSCAFTDPATSYKLYFGTNGTQESLVDDIRVVREGIDLSLVLPVQNGYLPGLISGKYTFSVWVRDDPSAGELIDSGVSAATGLRRAAAVTLALRAEGSSSGGESDVFARPAGGWSSWTELSIDKAVVTLDPTSKLAVFSLRISPTDLQSATGLDSGSILIASPSLTFHLSD